VHAVFFVYCVSVFTAVIFDESQSLCNCSDTVVITEQFCNYHVCFYVDRCNKSLIKKKVAGSIPDGVI
jgi:hypothetical protein